MNWQISLDTIHCCGVYAIYATPFCALSMPSHAVLTEIMVLDPIPPQMFEPGSNPNTNKIQKNTNTQSMIEGQEATKKGSQTASRKSQLFHSHHKPHREGPTSR